MKIWKWAVAFFALAAAEFLLSLRIAPPTIWDEGWYCLVTRAWSAFAGAAVSGLLHGSFGPAFSGFFEATRGTLFMHTTAKPLFTLLEMLALALGGGRLPAMALPQALAFAGTVLLTFRWAREWSAEEKIGHPDLAAALAAIAAALSPFIVIFGTTFLPNTIAGFFLVAALFLIWKGLPDERRATLTGLALAASVLTHYSLAPIVMAVVIAVAWTLRHDRRRLAIVLASFIGPFLLVAAASALLARLADARLQPGLIWSYLHEVRGQVTATAGGHQTDLLYYLKKIVDVDGWPSLLLLSCSFALLRSERKRTKALLAFFWGSLLFFSLLPTVGARTIAPIMPIGYLLGVFGLLRLTERLPSRNASAAALTVVLIFHLPFFIDLARFKNPFRAVLQTVPATSDPLSVSTTWPIFSCLTGRRVSSADVLDPSVPGVFIDDGRPWDDAPVRAFLAGHARLMARFHLDLSTRNFWDDEVFGQRVGTDRFISAYRW